MMMSQEKVPAAPAGSGSEQAHAPGKLEATLIEQRATGRKLLVPYVTAGMVPDWPEMVSAALDAGADAVEVGVPFSDPMMDGPAIQEASRRALVLGTSIQGVVAAIAHLNAIGTPAPLFIMSYYNILFRLGLKRAALTLARAGITGAVLPDLPLHEATAWISEAAEAGIANVMLVAPTTPDDRLRSICNAASGFVYGVGRMGVTGEQTDLARTSRQVAARLKAATSLPVIVGVGISTPEQAVEVCQDADGVIVGSGVVRRIMEGSSPGEITRFLGSFRRALDAG